MNNNSKSKWLVEEMIEALQSGSLVAYWQNGDYRFCPEDMYDSGTMPKCAPIQDVIRYLRSTQNVN